LISLQVLAGGVIALLGDALRWITGANPPDAFSVTMQLAVVIVGAPVYLGHWLWASALIRKDDDEARTPSRVLYLYLNQAIFMGMLTFALVSVIQSSLMLFSPPLDSWEVQSRWGTIIDDGLRALFAALLWLYHHLLADGGPFPARLQRGRLGSSFFLSSRLEAQGAFARLLDQLYILGASSVGLITAAGGLYNVQYWLFHDQRDFYDVAWSAASLCGGLLLWIFHVWLEARRDRSASSAAAILTWLYTALFSSLGAIFIFLGLYGLQTWIFYRLQQFFWVKISDLVCLLLPGLLLFAYHGPRLRRMDQDAPRRWLHWSLALAFSAAGVVLAGTGLFFAVRWLVSALTDGQPEISDAAALLLPGLLVWGYQQRVWNLISAALDLDVGAASPVGRIAALPEPADILRRLYLFLFSGAGVFFTALGLVGVQDWIFTRLGGQPTFELQDSLAWLVLGIPLWLYFWNWAGDLFATGRDSERRSNLRKAYLYLNIFAAVGTFIVTLAMIIHGALRAWLGLPTSGSLALSMAIVVASGVLWAYHAVILRRDIQQAGESSLQAGMQRLYWYLVAALGLAAFLIGLAGDLSVLIRWIALTFTADDLLRERFAGFTAALVAGLPVWLLAWTPAQRAARQPGLVGKTSRRSILRKAYLYLFAFAAVVVTLIAAVRFVYLLLNALFGVYGEGNLLADIAEATGFTVIFAAVWLYHGWVIRGDGLLLKKDLAAEREEDQQQSAEALQKKTMEWAGMPVLVVDSGDGALGRAVVDVLQRELPWLTLRLYGLSPETRQALPGDLAVEAADDLAACLSTACLVIAPWNIAALQPEIAACPAPKILIPTAPEGIYWAASGFSEHPETLVPGLVTKVLGTPRP
jgi:hypothetical protein